MSPSDDYCQYIKIPITSNLATFTVHNIHESREVSNEPLSVMVLWTFGFSECSSPKFVAFSIFKIPF